MNSLQDWSAEGYQMWIVNAMTRSKKNVDPEFMPFPEQFGSGSNTDVPDASAMPLANRAMVLQFVKSPASVNPTMTKLEKIYLQGEDTIFLNQSQGGGHSRLASTFPSPGENNYKRSAFKPNNHPRYVCLNHKLSHPSRSAKLINI